MISVETVQLPQGAELVPGKGDLQMLQVHTAKAQGSVYIYGAHVASWKPSNTEEVLWLSDSGWWENEKPIRGGIPICFPWFGPKKDDPGAPVHGLVRIRNWRLESVAAEEGSVTATFTTESDNSSKDRWPAEFALRYRVTFGPKLILALDVTNTGGTPFTAEESLHTYFSIGDIHQTRVHGLGGTTYIDKLDGMRQKKQEGPVQITAETDRVYLDTVSTVEIQDPTLRRRIRINKQNSRNTVVWNPWIAKSKAMPDFGDGEWTKMICVETSNVMEDAVRLEPKQQHTMVSIVEVLPE